MRTVVMAMLSAALFVVDGGGASFLRGQPREVRLEHALARDPTLPLLSGRQLAPRQHVMNLARALTNGGRDGFDPPK